MKINWTWTIALNWVILMLVHVALWFFTPWPIALAATCLFWLFAIGILSNGYTR